MDKEFLSLFGSMFPSELGIFAIIERIKEKKIQQDYLIAGKGALKYSSQAWYKPLHILRNPVKIIH